MQTHIDRPVHGIGYEEWHLGPKCQSLNFLLNPNQAKVKHYPHLCHLTQGLNYILLFSISC